MFGIFSCDDILTVSDPDSLSPDLALSELKGYESVLASAYNRVHNFGWMGQNGILAPEVLADNMDFANFTGRYETEYVNAVRSHMGRWGLFRGINDCNILINKIDDLEGLTAEEIATKEILKGEAYFLRALHFHDQAKVYGYEPGQEVNGFNLTTPIRTSPTEGVSDALNVHPRASNAEMYSQIKDDLNNAITRLSGLTNDDAPYRVGEESCHALLSRVLLFEGDYSGAAAEAELALSTNKHAELTTVLDHINSWKIAPHPESFFEIEIRATDWSTVDGVNSSVSSLTNNLEAGSQFILVASPELLAAVNSEANDIRQGVYSDVAGIPMGTKKCNKWNGEAGDYRENLPILRYSEVLLIAAEGYSRSGNDLKAQEKVNELRVARGLPETTATGINLTNLIMKERRVELAIEGHRWFDLKRLGLNIPKSAASQQPTLNYTDFRILANLPESELNLNDLLVQNPGY